MEQSQLPIPEQPSPSSSKNFLVNPKLPLIAAIIAITLSVGGILLLQNVGNPVSHTPPPAPAPVPSPPPQTINPSTSSWQSNQQSPIDTSNWKTYTNRQYGYEIKIPSSWFEKGEGPFNRLQSSSPNQDTDRGWPPPNNMWVDISPVDDCKPSVGYQLQEWGFDSIVFVLRRGVCHDNFWISLNLWPQDPDVKLHQATLDSIASSFETIPLRFKTYRNDQYGFEFKYLETVEIIEINTLPRGEDVGFGQVGLGFYDYENFEGFLSDGAFSDTLKYDSARNQWQIISYGEISTDELFCPVERKTKQGVSYYQIGDFRMARAWNFAFVTKKGIIVLSELDGQLLPDTTEAVYPEDIEFDNPQDVLMVSCNRGR